MNFAKNTFIKTFGQVGGGARALYCHHRILIFYRFLYITNDDVIIVHLVSVQLSVSVVRPVFTLYNDTNSVVFRTYFAEIPALHYPYPLNEYHSERVVHILFS